MIVESDMNILLDSSVGSFLQLIWVLLIFVFVLAITYVTTRWIGGYQKTHSYNKNLKIIEAIRIGNNKSICIIQTGTKYLVVAIGKDEVHLLTELSEDEIKDLSSQEENQVTQESFQEILSKLKEKLPKKQG